ncbi:Transcriptional coactivator [Branchiostoma belcheri]|nr:Transcriptional coactivator [Branchiostoma belcheri]
MSGVSAALQACTAAAMPDDQTLFSPCRFHLGNLTYAIVQISRGEIVVTMREYFQRRPEFRRGSDDDFDDLLPGKRCLNLSTAQWQALEENSQKIDTVLEAVTEKTEFLTDKLLNDIVGCNV